MSEMAEVLDALLTGTMSIEQAKLRARSLTSGAPRASGLPGRVLRGTSEVQAELSALNAAARGSPNRDRRKWAASMLIAEAFLGMEYGVGVGIAIKMIADMAEGTRAQCPSDARDYATAMIDAVVLEIQLDDGDLVETLVHVRRCFAGFPNAVLTADHVVRLRNWAARLNRLS
ncbi:MAG: hypothetical protein IPK33_22085 [Gemmatimonadetes bacterium]|nr:hypothetical protein [Gemmatimonadota bacterium]